VRYAFGGHYRVLLDERLLNRMISMAARSRRRSCTLGPVQVVFDRIEVRPMKSTDGACRPPETINAVKGECRDRA
jgi:hypothetical protein